MEEIDIEKILDMFEDDYVIPASQMERPQSALDREMFEDFNKRNPINKADGGRIPFAKAKLVKEKYLQTELTKEQKNNIKTWEKNTGQKFSDIPQTSLSASVGT